MKINLISFVLLILFSCKKEEKTYFEDGKIKNVSVLNGDVVNFKRFDQHGNLLFVGKFKNDQLIDTLYAHNEDDDFIIKIDSSDKEYFYGKYISTYSTGKPAKISFLRFNKGSNIDSIIGSSLLYGKEVVFLPNGKKAKEVFYEINGNSSKKIFEKKYGDIN